MTGPVLPGLRILASIKERGLGTAETAEGLGIPRERLYRVIKGRYPITLELATGLAAILGGSAETWLRIQTDYDFAAMRSIGSNANRCTSSAWR